jgi:hypothetical protein
MAGFSVDFESEPARISPVSRGIPFEIARRAALEEIRVGTLGDIAEGDAGSRVADQADIVEVCESAAEALDKLTEKQAGGRETPIEGFGRSILDALIAEGDEITFFELVDNHEDFLKDCQRVLEGETGSPVYDVLTYAVDNGLERFLATMDEAIPAGPTP